MSFIEDLPSWWAKLPRSTQKVLARVLSVLGGLLLAVVFHYVLYRIGLPSKPFIYVAF